MSLDTAATSPCAGMRAPRRQLPSLPAMVLAVGLWPVVAQAQPRDECRDRHVEHQIERALGLRTRNRDLAAVHLRALMQRCPTPRVRAQLGLEEASLEHWQDAHALLREALASAGDDWVTSQRERLARALVDVDGHLPRVSPQTNVPGEDKNSGS